MVTQKLQFIFCDFGTNIGHWVVSESVHIILQAEQKRSLHLSIVKLSTSFKDNPFLSVEGGGGRTIFYLKGDVDRRVCEAFGL